MKRKIIKIDEEKCNGCGLCIPNCPEGAMKIINGKARLINDSFCDGLGACMGHCPEGAISIEEREAGEYDELEVIKNIVQTDNETIKEHLIHLKEHNQLEDLEKAINFLKENNITVPNIEENQKPKMPIGCPGMQSMSLKPQKTINAEQENHSTLANWPLQLHLINPDSPHFKKSDLLISADCAAYAAGNFHSAFLQNKVLAIACPKLDQKLDTYIEKITTLINEAQINTISVITMIVPCCGGLLKLVQEAIEKSQRKVPLKHIVLDLQGNITSEDWL